MEENANIQLKQASSQLEQEAKKVLMPGQEHEDELDFFGAVFVGLVGKAVAWVKTLIY